MKGILITLALIVIFFIGIFAYTRALRADIYQCQRVTRARLSDLAYRFDPSEKSCTNAKESLEQMLSCIDQVRDGYTDNEKEVHDKINEYLEPALEDPYDYIRTHNKICEDFPMLHVPE